MNVPDSHSIIFSSGTTESINLIAYAWGTKNLNNDDHILITEMEHHSNIVPWQIISKKFNLILKYIPLTFEALSMILLPYIMSATTLVPKASIEYSA